MSVLHQYHGNPAMLELVGTAILGPLPELHVLAAESPLTPDRLGVEIVPGHVVAIVDGYPAEYHLAAARAYFAMFLHLHRQELADYAAPGHGQVIGAAGPRDGVVPLAVDVDAARAANGGTLEADEYTAPSLPATFALNETGDMVQGIRVQLDDGDIHSATLLPVSAHNTWSWGCTLPNDERPNGDARDAHAVCSVCAPLAPVQSS